jgi:hypothetical protein
MSKLIIHHHLGLGDHLDCNGMVRCFLEHTKFDTIEVFSKSNTWHMIDYMYRDEDRIKVIKIDSKQDEDTQVFDYVKSHFNQDYKFLRVGFENYPFLNEHKYDKNCWEFFYEQVSLPLSVRTDYFYYLRDHDEEQRVFNKLNPNNDEFIFIHEDESRGFVLNREHFIDKSLKVVENDMTENIFHFTKILEDAKEIHCMESSFKSLIDIFSKTENIFYHDFRNQPLGNKTNKNWRVIKYAQ